MASSKSKMNTSSSGDARGRHRRAHADARHTRPRRCPRPCTRTGEDAGDRRRALQRQCSRSESPGLRPSFAHARRGPRSRTAGRAARAACARSPAASAARTAVDDARSPSTRHGAHRLDAERRAPRARKRREVAGRAPCRSGSPRRPAASARRSCRTSTSSMNASGDERREPPHRSGRRTRGRRRARGELLELGAQRRQARRRRLRERRISRGGGSNVSTAGGSAEVVRGLDEPREHRLMAAMDAVEIADRQRDRRIGASSCREIPAPWLSG